MVKRSLLFLLPALIWASCNEPEPVSRCVLDRVEVLSVNPDYFDDTLDEGLPDLFVELRNEESQVEVAITQAHQNCPNIVPDMRA